MEESHQDFKIAVIGLGYVGLPLAIEFAKHYDVLGFDISIERIQELNRGEDRTQEANLIDLLEVTANKRLKDGRTGLLFSSTTIDLRQYNTFIITVPTPIDQFKKPDLTPLLKASEMVGSV